MSKFIVYLAVLLLCSCASTSVDIRHVVKAGRPVFICGKTAEILPASDESAPVVPLSKTELYENVVKRNELKELEASVQFDVAHPYLFRYLVELPEYTEKQLQVPEQLEQHLRLNDYVTYNRFRVYQRRREKNIYARKTMAELLEKTLSSKELYSSSAFVKQYLNYRLLEMELFDLLYKVGK